MLLDHIICKSEIHGKTFASEISRRLFYVIRFENSMGNENRISINAVLHAACVMLDIIDGIVDARIVQVLSDMVSSVLVVCCVMCVVCSGRATVAVVQIAQGQVRGRAANGYVSYIAVPYGALNGTHTRFKVGHYGGRYCCLLHTTSLLYSGYVSRSTGSRHGSHLARSAGGGGGRGELGAGRARAGALRRRSVACTGMAASRGQDTSPARTGLARSHYGHRHLQVSRTVPTGHPATTPLIRAVSVAESAFSDISVSTIGKSPVTPEPRTR